MDTEEKQIIKGTLEVLADNYRYARGQKDRDGTDRTASRYINSQVGGIGWEYYRHYLKECGLLYRRYFKGRREK